MGEAEADEGINRFSGVPQFQSSHEKQGNEIVKYFSVHYAKRFSFALIVTFIAYHVFIHIQYGTDTCKWLLSGGRFQGTKVWQPYGCMIHDYSQAHARNCLRYVSYWGKHNHFIFVGDSRIRQLFYQFVWVFDPNYPLSEKKHVDMLFTNKAIDLRVDFVWAPFVDNRMKDFYSSVINLPSRKPDFVITGSASWSIKHFNASNEALESFSQNLTELVPSLALAANLSIVLWMVQEPVVESLLNVNRTMITNKQIDAYNSAARWILQGTGVTLWESARVLALSSQSDSVDGIHFGNETTRLDIEIILNYYCNNHMNFDDGTCCSNPESITTIQLITAAFFGTCLVFAFFSLLIGRCAVSSVTNSDLPTDCQWFSQLLFYSAKLGIIILYFFLCDRTNFFMKENKYYTHVTFLLPFSYLMVLGFFFTEKTQKSHLLNRDQSSEWKGWMQVAVLIYHLTGASKLMPTYMMIRCLISSYLFLTGFAHFHYFWRVGDFSIHRLCSILFRYNFLVIVLCFVMNRPYQFYYFVPLVSYWLLVIYAIMAFWPRVTAQSCSENKLHFVYLLHKMIIASVVISLFYASEVLFEQFFLVHPFKALFVTSDDSILSWRFRWQLDRYSVLLGMLFALLVNLARQNGLLKDETPLDLFSRGKSILIASISILALLGYGIFSVTCKSKSDCNSIHAYISIIPIIAFIFLRNMFGCLRTKFSSFFAWFGKISLEMFVSQYHIWLSADTHGVLVLVPNYPVLNSTITSFIFICVAHEIHTITAVLEKYLVPSDTKSLVRNIFLFLVFLLPVAISDGVFGF